MLTASFALLLDSKRDIRAGVTCAGIMERVGLLKKGHRLPRAEECAWLQANQGCTEMG